MKFSISISRSSRGNETRTFSEETGKVGASSRRLLRNGFTMVEIAISLAVIGIALVAIIGVLPIGMRAQRDNRERTLINQDATVFLQAIRDGAQGVDDLTNYVYAITNFWTKYNANGVVNGSGWNGYTYTAAFEFGSPVPSMALTNGANIIGLLTTPEFTGDNGLPIPSLMLGGYSNHVVAYVHSISGLAVEKPPQNNDIMRADSFGYHILCANVPVAIDTNSFSPYLQNIWQAQPYNAGDRVFYNWSYWQATVNTGAGDIPGQSPRWVVLPVYPLELSANLYQLRLTFLWPLLPNGRLAPFPAHQTYRLLVGGAISRNYRNSGSVRYFFQPQVFNNTP